MQAGKFEETVDTLVQRDGTFHRDAYFFVREALDHTHKMVAKGSTEESHHVTGQELLEGTHILTLSEQLFHGSLPKNILLLSIAI